MRNFYHQDGKEVIEGVGKAKAVKTSSSWINVDDRLGAIGIYGGDGFGIENSGNRTAGFGGSLAYSEVFYPYRKGLWEAEGGDLAWDFGVWLIATISHEETAILKGRCSQLKCEAPMVRGVVVKGLDDKTYAVMCNFGNDEQTATFRFPHQIASAKSLVNNEAFRTDGDKLTVSLQGKYFDVLECK